MDQPKIDKVQALCHGLTSHPLNSAESVEAIEALRESAKTGVL